MGEGLGGCREVVEAVGAVDRSDDVVPYCYQAAPHVDFSVFVDVLFGSKAEVATIGQRVLARSEESGARLRALLGLK